MHTYSFSSFRYLPPDYSELDKLVADFYSLGELSNYITKSNKLDYYKDSVGSAYAEVSKRLGVALSRYLAFLVIRRLTFPYWNDQYSKNMDLYFEVFDKSYANRVFGEKSTYLNNLYKSGKYVSNSDELVKLLTDNLEKVKYFFENNTTGRDRFWVIVGDRFSMLMSDISSIPIIDGIVDLVHNKGSIMDKLHGNIGGNLQKLLDLKADIINGTKPLQDMKPYVSSSIGKLISTILPYIEKEVSEDIDEPYYIGGGEYLEPGEYIDPDLYAEKNKSAGIVDKDDYDFTFIDKIIDLLVTNKISKPKSDFEALQVAGKHKLWEKFPNAIDKFDWEDEIYDYMKFNFRPYHTYSSLIKRMLSEFNLPYTIYDFYDEYSVDRSIKPYKGMSNDDTFNLIKEMTDEEWEAYSKKWMDSGKSKYKPLTPEGVINFSPALENEEIVYGAESPVKGGKPVGEWYKIVKGHGIERALVLLEPEQVQESEKLFKVNIIQEHIKQFGADNVLWVPVKDYSVLDKGTFFNKILPFLKESEEMGKKVVVHCSAGMGRTGQVLAAWAVHGRGLPIEEALNGVRNVWDAVRIPSEALYRDLTNNVTNKENFNSLFMPYGKENTAEQLN